MKINNKLKVKSPNIFVSDTLSLKLGSPLKVPHYSWSNWGIKYSTQEEFEELKRLSEEGYREEWDLKTEKGHKHIALAAELAGLGDANKKLNEKVAEIVIKIIKITNFPKKVNLLDVGAGEGGTTIKILEKLSSNEKDRIFFTLLDPAEKAIKKAEERLKKFNLMEEDNYKIIIGEDLNIEHFIKSNSQDIVVIVAAIHHHAYLADPLKKIYQIMKKNSFLLIGDWHNSMWEHPNRVFRMFQLMQWKNKKNDLNRFVELYPKAIQDIEEPRNKSERLANKQIIEFWKQYSRIRTRQQEKFFVLEGHRPVKEYIKEIQNVSFLTATERIRELIKYNPQKILPESSLLCITIGEKNEQ